MEDSKDIRFERIWAMPNANTFSILPIKNLLEEEVDPSLLWIDPFARESKIAKITNDLNPAFDTDYHMDAKDFLNQFGDESVDGVLLDPPYALRQIAECYKIAGLPVTKQTTQSSFFTFYKKEVARIVKKGGKVISFGWNSGGVGKKLGFKLLRILLVPHGGAHNDTIVTVEVKE